MSYAEKARIGAQVNSKGFVIRKQQLVRQKVAQTDKHKLLEELIPFLYKFKDTLNTRNIYKEMFRSPVENVFYWQEEDYQGSIYSILIVVIS
jgi:hypothetical protein